MLRLKLFFKPYPLKYRHYSAESYQSHLGVKRNPSFKSITSQDVSFFNSILPTGSVITDPHDLKIYNVDWMDKYKGNAKVCLKPSNTNQVSEILKYCNSKRVPVVPQGGNTGLVGGSVPVFDEVIVNLGKMDKIKSFDKTAGILVCEAGAILENLETFLAKENYIMPLDLGAKGSCHIGGNVATNAGGLRLLRYGSLRGSVLGLEMVLPNGTILNNLSTLRKDNTGYDLKQLFIGSEGTLGIITGVSIFTPQKPKSTKVAIVGVESFDALQLIYMKTKHELGEILSAFEFWDYESLEVTLRHFTQLRRPLEGKYPFYVLLETSGSNEQHDSEKMETLLETIITKGLAKDGILSQDESQYLEMWKVRESIPEALVKLGDAVFKYDVSTPIPQCYALVNELKERFKSKGMLGNEVISCAGYGHVGDGNLHLNVACKDYTKQVIDTLEPFIYEWIASHRGSISAEHGLGVMKAQHIGYSKSKEMVDVMKSIKSLFDPNGIMNPYKFLPE